MHFSSPCYKTIRVHHVLMYLIGQKKNSFLKLTNKKYHLEHWFQFWAQRFYSYGPRHTAVSSLFSVHHLQQYLLSHWANFNQNVPSVALSKFKELNSIQNSGCCSIRNRMPNLNARLLWNLAWFYWSSSTIIVQAIFIFKKKHDSTGSSRKGGNDKTLKFFS